MNDDSSPVLPTVTSTTVDIDGAAALAFGALGFLAAIAVYALVAWCLSVVFRKSGEAPWKAWVPIVNIATIFKLGGEAPWKVVFHFIPVVNIYAVILQIIAIHRINVRFGHGAGMTVLAILIAPVWAILLARSEPTSPVPLADRIVPPASAEPAGGWALADAPPSGPLSTSPPPFVGATPVPISAGDEEPLELATVRRPGGAPGAPDAPASDAPDAAGSRPVPGAPYAVRPVEPSEPISVAEVTASGTGPQITPATPAQAAAVAAVQSGSIPLPPPAPPAPADVAAPPVEITAPPAPPVASAPPAAAAAPAIPPVPPAPAAPPAPPTNPGVPWADAIPAVERTPQPTPAPVEITAPPLAPVKDFELPPEAISALAASMISRDEDEALAAMEITGEDLENADEDGSTVVVDRRPKISWHLQVDGAGEFQLDGDKVLLGRKPMSSTPGTQALAIPDTTRTLSKLHARLDLVDGSWTITDLNSTNGVVVVDETGNERLLDPGTSAEVRGRFILGKVGMSIRYEGGGT